jgi:hypothetical protein
MLLKLLGVGAALSAVKRLFSLLLSCYHCFKKVYFDNTVLISLMSTVQLLDLFVRVHLMGLVYLASKLLIFI